MWLLLDNYDSFTYNLAQYLAELGVALEVVRNDAISVEEVRCRQPQAVVISPGPGTPRQAGITVDLIRALADTTPILGVCLGHQAIAEAFGGAVVSAPAPVHGKASPVFHRGHPLFRQVASPFLAARYHSLLVDRASLPPCLEIIAETGRQDHALIMALAHRHRPIFGVQFHPESILTQAGKTILANFLSLVDQQAWVPGGPARGLR